tara:strand:- start:4819 stop:5430 length:612 start_codon:yes stop_codon:yes gene_type:complete
MNDNRRLSNTEWDIVWQVIVSGWTQNAATLAGNTEIAGTYKRVCDFYKEGECVLTLRRLQETESYRPKPCDLAKELKSDWNQGDKSEVTDYQVIKDARERERERLDDIDRQVASDYESMPDDEFAAHLAQAAADDWRWKMVAAYPIRSKAQYFVVSERIKLGLRPDQSHPESLVDTPAWGKEIPAEPTQKNKGNLARSLAGVV